MPKLFATIMLLIFSAPPLMAMEYNKPGPIIRPPNKGFMGQGNYKGVMFTSYLEYKRLLISEDGIYYIGIHRVHANDDGPKVLRWRFRARCAVRPDLVGKVQVGIYYADAGKNEDEDFIEVDVSTTPPDLPPPVQMGWYQLWSRVCRGRPFPGWQ